MELKLNGIVIPEIEVGDVVVASNGMTCLVIDDGGYNEKYPIRLVNLVTFDVVNGFPSLVRLNEEKGILYDLDIVKVIKSNDLQLRVKEV